MEGYPIARLRINVKDDRDVRARELLETSPSWRQIEHSRHDGAKAYEIDSSTRVGKSYHVTLDHCECEDHVYRGMVCAHIRAVRLFTNIIHSHIHRAAYGIERELKRQQQDDDEIELTYF